MKNEKLHEKQSCGRTQKDMQAGTEERKKRRRKKISVSAHA
jgi:hypothetical protein